ncbi:hypothetical protein EJB05_19070, partial [Eragrostis curvula]
MDPSQMMFPMWAPPPAAPSDDLAAPPQPFLPPPNRGWKRKNPPSSAAGYQPPALGDLQVQNRAKARRWFKNPNTNRTKHHFFPKNKAAAPRNTTSYIIRAKRAGGIASLVSPCPVTPAVLPTPRLSPSREGLADMAQAQWGVDGYGSMKGLIRLRSSPQPANPASDDDEDGNSSGSDVEEHVEVERRLDHDLSRFEMVYPAAGEDAGGYVFEEEDDYDQDAHVARLEEENLTLKERLFLMEQEVGDMRRRLEALEARFSQTDGVGGGRENPGTDDINVVVSENSSEDNVDRVTDVGSQKKRIAVGSEMELDAGKDAVDSEKNGEHTEEKAPVVGSEKNDAEKAAVDSEKSGELNLEKGGVDSEKRDEHDTAEKVAVDSEKRDEHDAEMVDACVREELEREREREGREGGRERERERSRFPSPLERGGGQARTMEDATPRAKEAPWNANYGVVGSGDRRLAFSRQLSLVATTPRLARSDSSISMPPQLPPPKPPKLLFLANRPMRRLALLLALNVAYSATELAIGLFTGRVGKARFGCFPFDIWMRPVNFLTICYGCISNQAGQRLHLWIQETGGPVCLYKCLAYSVQVFLMFLSFSLAVEALHAFMQDESEHKHYLIVSAVTNLLVNLLGVWFFRSYARVNIVYRNAEDMNYHSVCLHVLADSIRSAGLILASWLLSLGVENAEVLCLGIVSVAVFMLVLPLFKATGNVLLQIAPGNVPPSAFMKCCRQIAACEDVSEVCLGRFWELVPGHAVGSLSIRVKSCNDDQSVLEYVHGLYQDLGIHDLTVQTDES